MLTNSLPNFDTVFCDWLDVTFSPEAFDYDEFYFAFTQIYPSVTECRSRNDGSHVLVVGHGSLLLSFKKNHIRVSASGGVLHALRDSGCYMAYLGMLSDWPHRVTRLDVSMDRDVSGPHVLSKLWKKYGAGLALGQRVLKTDRISSKNNDGLDTGTFYAGYKTKATRSVRVYDKAWEVMCKHSYPIGKRTRYEFVMRGGKSSTNANPSLRDAACPDALFWDMAKCLLPVPPNTPAWKDTSMAPWSYEHVDNTTTWEKFSGLLSSSPDIQRLNKYAFELGDPALKMLISAITKGVAQSSDVLGSES